MRQLCLLWVTAANLTFLSLSVCADTFGNGANQFAVEFVTIGDPGNPNDSGTTGSYFSAYGGVGYVYRMGVHEISRDMITKANSEGGLGLTLANMTSYGGNIGTRPASAISWDEAARFVNWLNMSQGYAPAYKFDRKPGEPGYSPFSPILLWQSVDAGFNPSNPYRNSNAHYFLPSEDEWYKAAYYSGNGTIYHDYATQRDAPTLPMAVSGGTAAGTSVYSQDINLGPADADQSGGMSHYGTIGQNGNVWEWTESSYDGFNDSPADYREIRGGDWWDTESSLRSSSRTYYETYLEGNGLGFRVASVVPEPTTFVLLCLGSIALALARKWVLPRSSEKF